MQTATGSMYLTYDLRWGMGGAPAGGQAFMIKLRKTSLRTPTSMIIEPPPTLNGSRRDPYEPRWRHLMYVFAFASPISHILNSIPSILPVSVESLMRFVFTSSHHCLCISVCSRSRH